MSIKESLKQVIPSWMLGAHRFRQLKKREFSILQSMPESARELYRRSALSDYAAIQLPEEDNQLRSEVIDVATPIYGDGWNHYSDALRPEIALGFIQTIDSIEAETISYLEIGSNQGISMAFIGLLLRRRGKVGRLVSIDPYFPGGYDEGSLGPYRMGRHVAINPSIKDSALRLYRALDLEVELLQATSEEGLKSLIRREQSFDLVYIDGYHEQLVPTIDFGLSYAVLTKPGLIILDDHLWPDVLPIKRLCDSHAVRVQETWKTATYRFN